MDSPLDDTKSARVISYLIGRNLVEEAAVIIKTRDLTGLRNEIQNDIVHDMVLECDEDRARELGLRKKRELKALEDKKNYLRYLGKLIDAGNISEAKVKFRQFLTING